MRYIHNNPRYFIVNGSLLKRDVLHIRIGTEIENSDKKPFSNICCQYSDAISTVKIESVLRHLAKSFWNMNMCSGKIVATKNCNFTKILCF